MLKYCIAKVDKIVVISLWANSFITLLCSQFQSRPNPPINEKIAKASPWRLLKISFHASKRLTRIFPFSLDNYLKFNATSLMNKFLYAITCHVISQELLHPCVYDPIKIEKK